MLRRPAGLIVGRGDYSANYNRWLYKSKERAIKAVLGNRITNASVLDVGSGLGYWLRWFRAQGASSLTGLDRSAEAIRRLETTFPDVRLVQSDISAGIPVDGDFDIVTAIDVLFHIPPDDAFERALVNVAAKVRPGGVLIATDRFARTQPHLDGQGCWRSPDAYRTVLQPRGLEIVDLKPVAVMMNGGLHDAVARPRRLLSGPVHRLEEALARVLYAGDGIWMPRGAANLQVMLARRNPR